MVNEPGLVLADEPTGNLDRETGEHIADVLYQLVADRGATLISVTHDPTYAQLADRRVSLRDGQLSMSLKREVKLAWWLGTPGSSSHAAVIGLLEHRGSQLDCGEWL